MSIPPLVFHRVKSARRVYAVRTACACCAHKSALPEPRQSQSQSPASTSAKLYSGIANARDPAARRAPKIPRNPPETHPPPPNPTTDEAQTSEICHPARAR